MRVTVGICHEWGNGEQTTFTVSIPASFPDVVDEARVQVMRMFQQGTRDLRLQEQDVEASDD